MLRYLGLSAIALLLSLHLSPVEAGFVPALDLSPPGGAIPGSYTYSLVFTTGLDAGNNNTPIERLDPNTSSLVLRGLGEVISASIIPTYSSVLTVSTSIGAGGTTDVLVTYVGPSTTSPITFADALIVTSNFTGTIIGDFDSQTTRNSGGLVGTPILTSGNVLVPNAVPEPGSMALFGIGLFGIVGFRRRSRKQLQTKLIAG